MIYHMEPAKLVILRGPSGAGKSTAAKELFKGAKRPTAFIEQDHYRFMLKPPGGKLHSKTIHQMILQDTLTALGDGYDVILEGLLTMKSYGEVFKKLIREHPTENYMFYFDISFDETLRRNSSRITKGMFTEEDMRQWYKPHDVTGYDFEHVISDRNTLKQTLGQIRNIAKIT
jgi:adenylate kinase family enzyme